MATKRLIETMSGYMKDKLAALTAPMFNKIESLAATFRHRKSTKKTSRFLFLNVKGNDKSYQTPLLGRYVATEHAHAARSLRSNRARTRCSVATDRARTPLGHYVAIEHAHRSRPVRPQKGPPWGSLVNPHRHAFCFVSIRVSVEILRQKQAVSRYVATCKASERSSFGFSCESSSPRFSFCSIGVSVEILRQKQRPVRPSVATQRPVRPQNGPPLGSLLNPHRNAFRFVPIGVSVEILRQKQVGLFLACFHSLRSDLSGRCLLNPRRNAFRFVSIGVSVEILRRKQRPVRPQKDPPLGCLLNPHRNAFRFVSIGVSVKILRRKQVGRFSACFHSLHSDLSDYSSKLIRLLLLALTSSFVFSFKSRSKRLLFLSELPLKLYDKKNRKDFRLNYTITLNLFTKIDILSKEKITRPSSSQDRLLRSDRASVLLGRYVATKLEPSSVATKRPSVHPARSLRSDRARAKLVRYAATECPSRSIAT
ncbi:hypothetical protein IGI04_036075 [Brassica rapa subsp. trilocularis]|uniref:Uncharacterized protein n=1 Tax=Brassica rapa subsp. trilocularis TaxID=1813537 RepID=A0ABQ7LFB7_BRACM|nr:hypothetical protein IGI04_036075 [Brassica rapa subsp. trilocularis]